MSAKVELQPHLVLADQGDNQDFWGTHPDVVASDVLGNDLLLWLSLHPPEYLAGTHGRRLKREPDFDFGGEGLAHPTFWDRVPGAAAAHVHEDYMEGFWGVQVWLKEPLGATETAPSAPREPERERSAAQIK